MKFIRTQIKQEKDIEDASCAYYSSNPLIREVYFTRLKLALSIAPILTNQEILDIGVGCGILIPSLIRYGNVYGIDHSEKYLDKSRKLCEQAGIKATLIKGNILNLPFENKKFNTIFCLSVLEHINDIDLAAHEISRVLKSDGTLIIGLPIERFLVNTLFHFINVKKEVEKVHVSDYKQVEETLKKYFYLEKSKKIPLNCFPDTLSLYKVLKYKNNSKYNENLK